MEVERLTAPVVEVPQGTAHEFIIFTSILEAL